MKSRKVVNLLSLLVMVSVNIITPFSYADVEDGLFSNLVMGEENLGGGDGGDYVGTGGTIEYEQDSSLDIQDDEPIFEDSSFLKGIKQNEISLMSLGDPQLDNREYDTITITRPSSLTDADGPESFVIMDRNLGAVQAGTSTTSYGYHYQWGNNYGFSMGCFTNGCTDSVTDSAVDVAIGGAIYDESYDNNGYYGENFIKDETFGNTYWKNGVQPNGLWGGSGDSSANNWGLDTIQETAKNRQGPCPDGRHVPSVGEWRKVMEYRCIRNSTYCSNTGQIGFSSNLLYFKTTTQDGNFINYIKLPKAGMRTRYQANMGNPGSYGYYWTSTPGAQLILSVPRNSDGSPKGQATYRNNGHSVRCFKNPDPAYTVTFNSNEGTVVDTQSVEEGYTATEPTAPTRSGYSFAGWYSDEELTQAFDFSTVITANITLYARWECDTANGYIDDGNGGCEKMETVTVTFDSNGGSPIQPQTILSGTKAIKPDRPTKENYVFEGRYLDNRTFNNRFNFVETNITGNITLYANYKEKPTCTDGQYYSDEIGMCYTSTNAAGNVYYADGTIILKHPETDEVIILKSTDESMGMYSDSKCNNGYHVPSSNEWGNVWDAWCLLQGYDKRCQQAQALLDDLRLSKDGYYSYQGRRWSYQNEMGSYRSSTINHIGTDAYSKVYMKTFTIYPNSPSYRRDVEFSFASRYDYSNSFRCFMDDYWTVTFNPNGGTMDTTSIKVTKGVGVVATEPQDPMREGSQFQGWYLLGSEEDFIFENTAITGNITLYAKWTCESGFDPNVDNTACVTKNIVTYDANGYGTAPSSVEVVSGGKLTEPIPAPMAEGYTFKGWYKEAGCTNAWDFENDTVTGDITLYAKWHKDSCAENEEWYEEISACATRDADNIVYYWTDEKGKDVISIKDPDSNTILTILDKNEGASVAGLGSDSYGELYQRGNNASIKSAAAIENERAEYKNYRPGHSFSGAIFRRGEELYDYWQDNIHYNNLWGGSGDTLSNGWGGINNGNIRQGPCDTGYHVPSIMEWNALITYWYNTINSGDKKSLENLNVFENSKFISDFKLPLAGVRDHVDASNYYQGSNGYYWSSSPDGESPIYARFLRLKSSRVYAGDYGSRAYGNSVRCFKDSTSAPATRTITFNENGGDILGAEGTDGQGILIQKVENGKLAQAPIGVTKDGATFSHWENVGDDSEFDLSTMDITQDVTLRAIWDITLYNITYHLDGGTQSSPKTGYTIEDETFTLVNPTRDHYIFAGWTGSNGNELQTTVTITQGTKYENLEYYANWYEDFNDNGQNDADETKYTVIYTDGVDGEEVFADEVTSNILSGSVTPAFGGDTTRSGYVFSGWNPAVADRVLETVTYEAEWKVDSNNNGIADEDEDHFTVTYTDGVDGEEVFADEEYSDILSGSATPAFGGETTRSGYVFSGWNPAVADKVLETVTYEAEWKVDSNNNGIADEDESHFTVTYTDGVAEEVFADQVIENILSGSTTPVFGGDTTRSGYVFSGWNPAVAGTVTADVTYTAIWGEDKNHNGIDDSTELVAITFNAGNHGKVNNSTKYTTDKIYLPGYNNYPAAPSPIPDNGWKFAQWSPAYKVGEMIPLSGAELEYTAQWNSNGGGSSSSGGGGGGGGSTKPDTPKEEQKPVETPKETLQKEDQQESSLKTQDDEQNTKDSQQMDQTSDKSSEGQDNRGIKSSGNSYTKEQEEAYEFARSNGITTKSTIQEANMNGNLTRIQMAKMLSQYAINVLGKEPDTSKEVKFNDVTAKRDADYDNGVTLAYQLGIMGQNMKNNKFRPNDEVTRGEFVTALSRLLYNTSDGEYKSTSKYYTHHIEKLEKEGIITKPDPKMKERRGYVMIMLKRSVES